MTFYCCNSLRFIWFDVLWLVVSLNFPNKHKTHRQRKPIATIFTAIKKKNAWLKISSSVSLGPETLWVWSVCILVNSSPAFWCFSASSGALLGVIPWSPLWFKMQWMLQWESDVPWPWSLAWMTFLDLFFHQYFWFDQHGVALLLAYTSWEDYNPMKFILFNNIGSWEVWIRDGLVEFNFKHEYMKSFWAPRSSLYFFWSMHSVAYTTKQTTLWHVCSLRVADEKLEGTCD